MKPEYTKKESVHPIDKHVGERIRARRMLLAISQDRLASSIGLTFQQVQKYERGHNRVSASRLYEIAKALSVEPSFFFEGLPSIVDGTQETDPMRDTESLVLIRNYRRMESGTQAHVMALVKAIASRTHASPVSVPAE